jgi:guanyl-specific ribonuclease Sa
MKKLLSILLVLAMLVSLAGCAFWEDVSVGSNSSVLNELNDTTETTTQDAATSEEDVPEPDGSYTSKEDVALYIHLYGCLPSNFITKSEARKLGWKSGSVEKYAPGKCIGGDRFGNYEGLLPKAAGRTYYECDIDTLGGKSRGAKRIVFSNDGLVYYTSDHYASFTLLYGEE